MVGIDLRGNEEWGEGDEKEVGQEEVTEGTPPTKSAVAAVMKRIDELPFALLQAGVDEHYDLVGEYRGVEDESEEERCDEVYLEGSVDVKPDEGPSGGKQIPA